MKKLPDIFVAVCYTSAYDKRLQRRKGADKYDLNHRPVGFGGSFFRVSLVIESGGAPIIPD
jgi:hypothetical protein